MHVLIVSATPFEIQPFREYLSTHFAEISESHFKRDEMDVSILVTGVGMVNTAFALGHVLANHKFNLVINAGIAGAFDPAIKVGEVVQVVSEQFGDLGVEEKDGQFTDVFEMGLINSDQLPFKNGLLVNEASTAFNFLPLARGLTVNKVHGTATSIAAILKKYNADVETMEGAAFFYACLQAKMPFLQIRSISNHVEPRNRGKWDLPLAIKNVNEVLINIMKVFSPTLS